MLFGYCVSVFERCCSALPLPDTHNIDHRTLTLTAILLPLYVYLLQCFVSYIVAPVIKPGRYLDIIWRGMRLCHRLITKQQLTSCCLMAHLYQSGLWPHTRQAVTQNGKYRVVSLVHKLINCVNCDCIDQSVVVCQVQLISSLRTKNTRKDQACTFLCIL